MKVSTIKALLGIACFCGVFQGLLNLVGGLLIAYDKNPDVI